MPTHTHTHVYERIGVHIPTHMHIYTYIHVCPHTHIHIYTHTYQLYIWTHASTPGTTTWQWTCEEPLQTQGALHVSFVRRNQTTFRTSNARTSLYPLPETPIPLHPPSPLPNIPQNSLRTVGKRCFTVQHWTNEQSPKALLEFIFDLPFGFPIQNVISLHSSEEAPRSFKKAPCVVVERLERKQRCTESQ